MVRRGLGESGKAESTKQEIKKRNMTGSKDRDEKGMFAGIGVNVRSAEDVERDVIAQKMEAIGHEDNQDQDAAREGASSSPNDRSTDEHMPKINDAQRQREELIRTGVITPFENAGAAPASRLRESTTDKPLSVASRSKRRRVEPPPGDVTDDDTDSAFSPSDDETDDAKYVYKVEASPRDDIAEGSRSPIIACKDGWDVAKHHADVAKYCRDRGASQVSGVPTVQYGDSLRVPSEIHERLFDYQRTGVKWLWELHRQGVGGILGDEMGLGKLFKLRLFSLRSKLTIYFDPPSSCAQRL